MSAPWTPPAPGPGWNQEQSALSLLGGGLVITSTGTPALNGTYQVSGLAWQAIQAEVNALFLSGGTTFANGGTSQAWPDASGAQHIFSVAEFHNFAMAIANFVANCALYSTNVLTTAPPNTATIA
jgi:hypothetical protein